MKLLNGKKPVFINKKHKSEPSIFDIIQPCEYSYIIASNSPLGSCGLFAVRGISNMSHNPRVVFEELVVSKRLMCDKPHCIALDREDNFELYEEVITPFLVQKNEPFQNPKGGMTMSFVIDVTKIEEYLTEDKIDKNGGIIK